MSERVDFGYMAVGSHFMLSGDNDTLWKKIDSYRAEAVVANGDLRFSGEIEWFNDADRVQLVQGSHLP